MLRKFLPFVLALLTACEGCGPEEPNPPLTELDKLPPATQEGKYTFGCLLNGKAFVTKSTTDVSGHYQVGLLQVTGSGEKSQIGFHLSDGNGVISVGEYSLLDYPYSYVNCIEEINSTTFCIYEHNEIISGKIVITKFDKINYIISGTFEFVAKMNGCIDIVVTDGRFDIKYAP